jgi:phosphoglycerate dehydrogenase-like enzyme
MLKQYRILYIPTRHHTERVFAKEDFEILLRIFDVVVNTKDRNLSSDEVAELVPGMDGLVTGWGSPELTDNVFERADKLKIIVHSAGSIRPILQKTIVERHIIPRGICVVNCRRAIAVNVAESTVGIMIMALRRCFDHIQAYRETGVWRSPEIPANGQYLLGANIGIIGASMVGREVIRLLKPFDVKILVYDPYLSDWEAGRLNVKKAELNEVFEKCDAISIHAPLTDETYHMIGRDQLKRMKDGAVLINTARGGIIDHNALLEECEKGRIIAFLDVTEPEPLPPESPFRRLKNVFITPHIAGAGYYGYHMIGKIVVKSLEDFFAGRIVEDALNMNLYNITA